MAMDSLGAVDVSLLQALISMEASQQFTNHSSVNTARLKGLRVAHDTSRQNKPVISIGKINTVAPLSRGL